MKKISEMNIAKEAILSKMESSNKGGLVGLNTNYYGPAHPSSLTTLVDGAPWGNDNASGSLFGDTWSFTFDQYSYTGILDVHPK